MKDITALESLHNENKSQSIWWFQVRNSVKVVKDQFGFSTLQPWGWEYSVQKHFWFHWTQMKRCISDRCRVIMVIDADDKNKRKKEIQSLQINWNYFKVANLKTLVWFNKRISRQLRLFEVSTELMCGLHRQAIYGKEIHSRMKIS